MHLVLDTHALLWWLAGDTSLSRAARGAIEDELNVVHVSAVSAWEITTKHRIGRLSGWASVAADFEQIVADQGFLPLPITIRHGQAAGSLPGPLRDPFDRMLIAQSMLEAMALVSNETVFDAYGVRRLW
ncbi:MAG: type II toxin-antitoxin system VapC family toxin [Proteobacteria bacterium]|nr:type II toxin-antitoxin system VapC family toxin [Pseudomonadota bacterium]MBI3498373.1 type II toxin-antitoxin system VapC family toxin [Pseudomonadota bacterium]